MNVKQFYFTLPFAQRLGIKLYQSIARGEPSTVDQVGEWIFAEAAFGRNANDDLTGFINGVVIGELAAHSKARIAEREPLRTLAEQLMELRAGVPAWVDDVAAEIAAFEPTVVGFTSVFQQHVASLAAARRLRASRPEAAIVFGGANCEGAMGAQTVLSFPFVDAVVSGEADLIVRELFMRLHRRESLAGLQGVLTRENVAQPVRGDAVVSAPLVRNLDELPEPDYDDFFGQFAASRFEDIIEPRLLFETSRGCWWGQKSHCTFCGLNGKSMVYRSKSPERAFDELRRLHERYGVSKVDAVDNILDMKYFEEFLPLVRDSSMRLEIFYETKANLREEQVRLLRDAGVLSIQPGIESLSTHVLSVMRKGVRALANIQLLKWCKKYGVRAHWNLLWGFPGEGTAAYARIAALIPNITHLYPPHAHSALRLDRFSPNFDEAEARGFRDVTPYPSYRFIYPLEDVALANLAYFFTYEYGECADVLTDETELDGAVLQWKREHEESDLFWLEVSPFVLVWDLRPAALQRLHVLDGLGAEVIKRCDAIVSDAALQTSLDVVANNRMAFESAVEELVARGLLIRDGQEYLGLALPLTEYTPNTHTLKRFRSVIESLGEIRNDTIVIDLDVTSHRLARDQPLTS